MPEVPSNFSEWDGRKAGEALGARPHLTHDVAHGLGDELEVSETTLEVYRDAGVARVTTPDARIELFRVPSYAINGERVVFEQGEEDNRSRLLVRNDGKVSFYPVLRATESSRTGETADSGRQDSPTPSMPSETLRGRESQTTTPSSTQTTTLEGAKNGEVEQQMLQGRLGRDPWFSGQGEEPLAGFPLAIHDDRGQTTWHRVVVFGEAVSEVQAAAQKGQLRKGRLVQVQGTEVTREEVSPRGARRPVKEFHASTVIRMTSGTVPHPKGR